jgi:hypothetical protein
MLSSLVRDLDRILRRQPDVPGDDQATNVGRLLLIVLTLGIISGVQLGAFALIRTWMVPEQALDGHWIQPLASAVKFPLLFLFTLVVTVPSLYVFNALFGPRLSLSIIVKTLMSALAVTLAVLSSMLPIAVFFCFSTSNYLFMKLLYVFFAAAAGILGVVFLLRILRVKQPDADTLSEEHPTKTEYPGMLLGFWTVLFALVGSQMGWIMRPFIGDPSLPFTWFRTQESNVFIDLAQTIGKLFGGS